MLPDNARNNERYPSPHRFARATQMRASAARMILSSSVSFRRLSSAGETVVAQVAAGAAFTAAISRPLTVVRSQRGTATEPPTAQRIVADQAMNSYVGTGAG